MTRTGERLTRRAILHAAAAAAGLIAAGGVTGAAAAGWGAAVGRSVDTAPAAVWGSSSTWTYRAGAADFRAALGNGGDVAVAGGALRLAAGEDGYASRGLFVSPVFWSPPFDDVVASWNASAPAGTSLGVEVRALMDDGWSRWYTMATWSEVGGASAGAQADTDGYVDVDTLVLRRPAMAAQYRLRLATEDAELTPAVRRLALAIADTSAAPWGPTLAPLGRAMELAVPTYSQLEQDPAVAWNVCSPTCLTMALHYYGVATPIGTVIGAVRDRRRGIYGNWPLNTALAGAAGLDATVERYYSIAQVEREIAAGRPVILSIRFEAGELDGAPIARTGGHLILARGFTAGGDVVVNDPVAPSAASVRRVYRRAQLERIWRRAGGVVYRIGAAGSL